MCTDFSILNNSSELQEQIELLVEYLEQNYEFRHNVLSDVYEFRELTEEPKPFRPFSREARNSLVLRIKRDGLEVPNLGKSVDEIVFSEETPQYDPVKDWLQSLPAWDGQDHVSMLFCRIPGITSEQHHMLAIWLRSAVAQTGSRRFLCIRIPEGQMIDVEAEIDYDQLYAQVVSELQDKQMRYWFTNEETMRLEQLNHEYQRVMSLEGMIDVCFRHPHEGEVVKPLPVDEILTEMVSEFPALKTAEGLNLRLGRVLKAQNFERKRITSGSVYYIVPKRVAA